MSKMSILQSFVSEIFIQNNLPKVMHMRKLSEGYYSTCYIASCNFEGNDKKIVIKVYNGRGLNQREECALNIIRKYSVVKVPSVLLCYDSSSHSSDENCPDILVEEFVPGVMVDDIDEERLKYSNIPNEIVNNLISIHDGYSNDGFGYVFSSRRYDTWREFYAQIVDETAVSIEELEIKRVLSKNVVYAVKKIQNSLCDILSDKINYPALCHGDYNVWNIIADPFELRLTGIIDPMDACFSDPELDLYQLNFGNGHTMRLLDIYVDKAGCSRNFKEKLIVYEFISLVRHVERTMRMDLIERVENISKEITKLL